jgi:hypothetical protein
MNPYEQGIKYKAINATFNTAVKWNGDAETAFSENTASVALVNTSGNLVLRLNYIRLIVAAAGTNGTNLSAVVQLDTTNRYTSGGSTLVPFATNAGSYLPAGQPYFGQLVTANASANAKKLTGGALVLNTSNPAVNEHYLFLGEQPPVLADIPAPKALIALDSIIVPAGGTLLVHLFSASQSAAPTAFIDLEWTER